MAVGDDFTSSSAAEGIKLKILNKIAKFSEGVSINLLIYINIMLIFGRFQNVLFI